jgi:hypothetical protein
MTVRPRESDYVALKDINFRSRTWRIGNNKEKMEGLKSTLFKNFITGYGSLRLVVSSLVVVWLLYFRSGELKLMAK